MTQETGETRNAIIEQDEKQIQAILDANKNRKEKYWIVIFAKPAGVTVDGKPTLVKHIKAYPIKPAAQVGMIVGEVDNTKDGKDAIKWDINMPQRPFDFDGLLALGAQPTNELVVETTSIPGAYLTK